MAVEAMASTSTEVRDAVIERLSPPEFASETYDRAESTQTGREVETPELERVAAADEIRVEVSGGFRSAEGAHCFGRIRGYLATMRKQAQPMLAAIETQRGQRLADLADLASKRRRTAKWPR